MSPAEIQVKINLARNEMKLWQEILDKKSCRDCKNWTHPVCGLAAGIMPPAEVINVGCPSWVWDGIPF